MTRGGSTGREQIEHPQAERDAVAALAHPLGDYTTAIETELRAAYTEPAGDVRGYIASVKAPVA